MEKSVQGARGGNVTLRCRPQGAPRPTIKWEGPSQGEILPNGDLELSFLSISQSGVYTCIASNDLGEARNTTTLAVMGEG